jgi:hypothetical protein
MEGPLMIRNFLRAAATTLAVTWLAVPPVTARQWNPDARAASLDYTQIFHQKSPGEIVFLWWVTPEAFPAGSNNQTIQDVLSRYIVLGIAHGRTSTAGQMSFDPIDDLRISDATLRSLPPLPANAMPSELAQTIASLQMLARQSLGPMGQGIRFFVFDGSTIHTCAAGKMTVPFDGETYTYDTPIPGCPK